MVAPPVYNASNSPSSSSPQERIPAWKRLGLKLRNAEDTKGNISSTNGVMPSTLKRSSPDVHLTQRVERSLAEPLAKRRRVESLKTESTQSNGGLARTSHILPKDQNNRLKKKVSFTAETKLEDGGKELITAWEQDDYAYYEQKAADNDAKEALRVASAAQNKLERSNIHSKGPSDSQRKSKDAFHYLNLYHRSRSSWKFNKNREVWILRHILSTDDIPTSFNIALASYVHGLGSSQARSRLLGQCQQALGEGQEKPTGDEPDSDSAHMEDPDRRKAYHDDAVRRFKRSLEDHLDDEQRKADEDDPEYQRWLSRRRRAELLLWAVTPSSSNMGGASTSSQKVKSEPHSSTSAKSVNGVLPNRHLSKKKNRTAVVELSSSSEDESGGSDEEEDGSELTNWKGVANSVTNSSSAVDESSSAASSLDRDSNSEAESANVTSRLTYSSSSSADESETDTHPASGKRQQSAISISSRSDTSTQPVSSTLDENSSSSSLEEDDEEDQSDSGSSTTTGEAQSRINGDSETTGSSDEEDGG